MHFILAHNYTYVNYKINGKKMKKNTEIREITFFLFMICFINCTPVCFAVNTGEAISWDFSAQETLTLSHNVRTPCDCASIFPGSQEKHPIATEKQTQKYSFKYIN